MGKGRSRWLEAQQDGWWSEKMGLSLLSCLQLRAEVPSLVRAGSSRLLAVWASGLGVERSQPGPRSPHRPGRGPLSAVRAAQISTRAEPQKAGIFISAPRARLGASPWTPRKRAQEGYAEEGATAPGCKALGSRGGWGQTRLARPEAGGSDGNGLSDSSTRMLTPGSPAVSLRPRGHFSLSSVTGQHCSSRGQSLALGDCVSEEPLPPGTMCSHGPLNLFAALQLPRVFLRAHRPPGLRQARAASLHGS